jgi:hypothetical protein
VSHQGTRINDIANSYEGFVPVVNEKFGMFCDLDILFLRAENTGGLVNRVSGSGDIDNRIKTLLDALCVPKRGEIGRKPDDLPDPRPMFVLLSDDSLVTSLRVVTDRLLTTESNDPSEACLIIHVTVRTINPLGAPYGIPI